MPRVLDGQVDVAWKRETWDRSLADSATCDPHCATLSGPRISQPRRMPVGRDRSCERKWHHTGVNVTPLECRPHPGEREPGA